MPQVLLALLTAFVPVLVGEAEKLFDAPKSGSVKHGWVIAAVDDLVAGLIRRSPPTFQVSIHGIAGLLEELIEKKLDEIDP